MRSLAHELTAQRTSAGPRHETRNEAVPWDAQSWTEPTGPSRRAVLRRALRQGLLRPAVRAVRAGDVIRAARPSAANEQIPADHQRAEAKQESDLPDPAWVPAS
jgi:hypothetical protein